MTERIILYGSLTCPMVPPVRSLLQRASAEFDYVDILFNQEARRRVIEINQGNASVRRWSSLMAARSPSRRSTTWRRNSEASVWTFRLQRQSNGSESSSRLQQC